MRGKKNRFQDSILDPTNQDIRNTDNQIPASTQPTVDRTHTKPFVADANDPGEAITTGSGIGDHTPDTASLVLGSIKNAGDVRTSSMASTSSLEGSSSEDSLRETPSPPSWERLQYRDARRQSNIDHDGDRNHFVFPDPMSPAIERGTSSNVANMTGSSSSEKTIIQDKLSAELCSPRRMKVDKGKGIAREMPATNEQKKNFLPLLKEDSHFPRQPGREEQTHKLRSNSFHSKLTNLNKNLAATSDPGICDQPEQSHSTEQDRKTLRQLQLKTELHNKQIKNLYIQTKALAETLKRLRTSLYQDIQNLEKDSRSQRENSDRLVRGWEDMRRELLELKVRMAHEKFACQRPVSGDEHGDEDGDGDKQGRVGSHVLVLSPGSTQTAPVPYQEVPFDGYHPFSYTSPFPANPRNSNDFQAIPGAPPRGPYNNPIESNANAGSSRASNPIAGPSFSRPSSAYHGIDAEFEYNSVPAQNMYDGPESHVLQNPQGCRWRHCPVCWNGGERGVWFE